MDMEIKTVEPEQEKKVTPQMALANIPCLDMFLLDTAWKLIKPVEEEFAKLSLGEYTIWDVYLSILYGGKHLYLAYLDSEGKVGHDQFRPYVLNCLAKNWVEKWMGFMILEFGKTEMHIFQAYITPEYQKTDALQRGLEWLKEEARSKGAPALSFDAQAERTGWDKIGPKLGFQKINTRFRISLKE